MENAGMNKEKSTGTVTDNFANWCKKMLKKSCDTRFQVSKGNTQKFSVPVLALIVGGIVAFWLIILLLIAGMFTGHQYRFIGLENTSIDINDMCQKASKTCESIKNDVLAKKNNQ